MAAFPTSPSRTIATTPNATSYPRETRHVPLADVTAEDLDPLYARLVKEGVGARTINHVHAAARVSLQRAVKKRLIPYNPTRDADPPRYSTSEREYLVLCEDEVARFFEAAEGTASRLSSLRPSSRVRAPPSFGP